MNRYVIRGSETCNECCSLCFAFGELAVGVSPKRDDSAEGVSSDLLSEILDDEGLHVAFRDVLGLKAFANVQIDQVAFVGNWGDLEVCIAF